MYNAVFVMISVLTTRAIAYGLAYVVIWEGLVGNFVGGARLLSVGQYSLGVANAFAHQAKALNATQSLGTSVVMGVDRDRRHDRHRGARPVRVLAEGGRGLGLGERPLEPPDGLEAPRLRRGGLGRCRLASRPRPGGYLGVSGPGRKAGPWPGMITVAAARIRSRLAASAGAAVASGSSAGPSGPHQAWVHA